MSLELGEKEFNKQKTALEDEIESLETLKQTKAIKTKLKKYTDDLEKLDSNKSEVIKKFILDYFPMVIEKAVSASRHISNEINEKTIEEFTHQYDNGRASISHAKELGSKTLKIIKKWDLEEGNKTKDHFFDDINDLARRWYGIDTTELLGDEYDFG